MHSLFQELDDLDGKSGAADSLLSTRKRILVPYPVDKAYDYAVPDDLDLKDGDYVCVPLGGREVTGVVWGEPRDDVASSKIKAVIDHYPLRAMPKLHRDFLDKVASYTMNAKGSVLKMSLSAPGALTPPKPVSAYTLAPQIPDKLSDKQSAVVNVLADGEPLRASEIADQAGCSTGVVNTLLKNGVLTLVERYNPAPCKNPDAARQGPTLSDSQQDAADALVRSVRDNSYSASLLDGVTGAGKTETYFEAVAEALKQGRQVLILLPEIALSNAFLERFKSRFGCAPALWHSGLSSSMRKTTWRGVVSGKTKVVIGARSALFLPFSELGLIIVDEEHDPAFKQEEGTIYHARDMAVLRAHMGNIPIVLVSATPSLETIHNAWNGRYNHLILADRYGGARMPEIDTIDMRTARKDAQHFISDPLIEAIEENIEAGQQSLLFLNRRGYAPLTLCRSCGHRMDCPRCTAWLVEHRNSGKLHCHHCGFFAKKPEHCPSCEDTDTLVACGPGVERIFEEAKEIFPEARIMVLASDTADDGESLRAMLDKIRNNEIDLIIGTQIIAKGHHFPNLTLVGVIDADLGLQGGDLRASERTYQLLHQVAGRAGREDKKGHVLLQSFMPEHRIIQALASGARDDFLSIEADEREMAHMPPFSRLAGIIVSGREESQVIETAKMLGQSAPQGAQIQTLGPAPAPFARLRGKFRYRLLVIADKNIDIQKTVSAWVSQIKTPSNVRIQIDIDPQSFY